MPATGDPLTEERWAAIVAELRAAPPRAPEALRERVLAAAALPPPRRGRARRLAGARVLVPAAAAIVVVGVAAGLRALPPAGIGEEALGTAPERPALRPGFLRAPAEPDAAAALDERAAAPFAPVPVGRLQEQRIELGVRVPDVEALSDATARAMEATRGLGGYVVAAHYDVPDPAGGDSTLVVRIPVARVQEALARFTALGTIVSQDVRLQDLQPAYDRRERELESLRTRIARLEAELRGEGLTDEQRARLRTQLAAARRGVEARQAQQRAAEQQGRLARVELALTTRSAALPPPEDGMAVTLRAAARVLAQLLVWLAAGAIVAGPFLALALLALVAARSRRRVLQARLLERS